MTSPARFVDIHCHLLPGIDDGAADLPAALAMAKLAVADGIETIVATPHQMGAYAHNEGGEIRRRTAEFQNVLHAAGVPLRVLPGADVRIEEGLAEGIINGDVLTLADADRHVLLELPHQLYFPLDGLLNQLARRRIVGVLSHPERNGGLLDRPEIVAQLVEAGCLMQITAGSLSGTFGPRCRQFAEWMLERGMVHFVATDAHSPRRRRPILSRAFQRVVDLVGQTGAVELCCEVPRLVAMGRDVPIGFRTPRATALGRFFRRRKAG
ncbi:MAG: CpsB/CapC family capsule biosynthesis tyrosine phosphatase [Planctomycetota bacterium]